jgi:hypothetical protein
MAFRELFAFQDLLAIRSHLALFQPRQSEIAVTEFESGKP